jgi:threonine dehydratase
MPQSQNLAVAPSDIDAAATVIAPYAVRTPLLSPPVLGERVGANVFIKPELLQRTGSFKFRGAFNKLSFPLRRVAMAWWRFPPVITPRVSRRRRRSLGCTRLS